MDKNKLKLWFSHREKRKNDNSAEKLFPLLIKGNLVALSKAITLIESKNSNDINEAETLIQMTLPYVGKSKRIGITGVPGVGKSSFIENFGLEYINNGAKVAVLAVDPSSELNKGSILGDKTRMSKLAVSQHAFIRPSPSGLSLGGVAKHTRECIYLCEAAGFDIIIIETVGVGQSETSVRKLVDYFLLLHLPNSGDELQGIKRGIMEVVDGIVVNKADGELVYKAKLAKKMLENSLNLFQKNELNWKVNIFTASMFDLSCYKYIIKNIEEYYKTLTELNLLKEYRIKQDVFWLREYLKEKILNFYFENETYKDEFILIQNKIINKEKAVFSAANEFLKSIKII